MTPEEAARAINPYIYDKKTPPSRIEEDLKIRLQWVATFDGYMAQLQGIMMWEAYSRIAQDHRSHTRCARRNRSACAPRKRKADRAANLRIKNRHDP